MIAAIRKFSPAPTMITDVSCARIETESRDLLLMMFPIDSAEARIVADKAPNHGSFSSRSDCFPEIIPSLDTRADAATPSMESILSIN
jgi:hypothetical protein